MLFLNFNNFGLVCFFQSIKAIFSSALLPNIVTRPVNTTKSFTAKQAGFLAGTFIGGDTYFFDPLEQFEIVNPLLSSNSVFNTLVFNFFFYAHNIPAITLFFLFFFVFTRSVAYNNFTIVNLAIFKLVKNLFIANVPNAFQNQDTFFLLYFIFIFILYHNLAGMLPFNYTTTSLIVTSFLLSITIFSFVCFKNIMQNGWFFFDHFLPAGVNLHGARWMIIIEIISFFMRVISLGVRLFANLLSGHILLKVLIGFFIIGLASFFSNINVFLLVALLVYATVLLLITALEIFISFLQSYTFLFLSIIYFSEVVKGIDSLNFKTIKETIFTQKPNLFINFSFLNIFFFNSEFLFNAPKKGQLYFQEAGSELMEEIILFHEDVMCFLVFIVLFILYLLIVLVKCFYIDADKPYVKEYIKNYNSNHNSALEIVWTMIPALILLIIVVPSFVLLYTSIGRLSKSPTIVIKVIGHQWYWTYEYLDVLGNSVTTDSYLLPVDELIPGSLRNLEVTNRIALPINTPIRILVTSADVIHSWAVPGLGVKIDACPGRLNEVIVTVNKPGAFYGQCSEICGLNHGFMPIVVEAFEPSHYVLYDLESANSEFSAEEREVYDSIENVEELLTPYNFSICDYLNDEEIEILMTFLETSHDDDEFNDWENFFELNSDALEELADIEAALLEDLFTEEELAAFDDEWEPLFDGENDDEEELNFFLGESEEENLLLTPENFSIVDFLSTRQLKLILAASEDPVLHAKLFNCKDIIAELKRIEEEVKNEIFH